MTRTFTMGNIREINTSKWLTQKGYISLLFYYQLDIELTCGCEGRGFYLGGGRVQLIRSSTDLAVTTYEPLCMVTGLALTVQYITR